MLIGWPSRRGAVARPAPGAGGGGGGAGGTGWDEVAGGNGFARVPPAGGGGSGVARGVVCGLTAGGIGCAGAGLAVWAETEARAVRAMKPMTMYIRPRMSFSLLNASYSPIAATVKGATVMGATARSWISMGSIGAIVCMASVGTMIGGAVRSASASGSVVESLAVRLKPD